MRWWGVRNVLGGKRWNDFVDSCFRAADTALTDCRKLGRDSAHPPLGLGSNGVATGEDTGTADGGGGSHGLDMGETIRLGATTTQDSRA